MAIDKTSKEYQQGLKDGVDVTCDNLLRTTHTFKRDMYKLLDLFKKQNRDKNGNSN